ncbi:signal recognition particle protein [Ophiostoma piceae UAMH 11346]|uniref:Signal recognition particle subunit SRP72 n=1 Tax=Ophiostoma piceae (strain UAMH 11346) TaxID=1262450 RepID=S3C7G7_OPHP1|nr:signal recognition particle protein [Ophiostoma piceae UAMH 11346]
MASAVNALNSLLRGTSIEDHEEALKLANAAISAPGPSGSIEKLTAQHAKVVALLKLDRFDDALRIIASGGDALAERCVLEHAYALYKTGDLDTAATIATSASSSRALKHIAAQVAYRDEKYDRAASLYANLAPTSTESGEEADVRINALAVSAQRSWQGRGQSTLSAGQDTILDAGRREDLETFETAYNAACAALSRSDVARASILLRRAQQLCEASDELGDDDKRAELLPILIQQAYALTRLGRHDDAAAVQKAIDASECEGAAKIVAATNTVVAQNAALGTSNSINPYVVQRQLETALPATPTGSDRLFSHQERILRRNQYAIELQCYKFKGVQSRTAKQLKQLTKSAEEDKENAPSTVLPETVDLGIFGAAAKAELQTGKEALRRILPLLEHRPDDIGLLLTAIQLQLQSKNAEAALGLLESFFKRAEESSSPTSARFAPGLVALAVSLYKLQGRHNAVRVELSKAISHWQASSTSSSSSTQSATSSTPASLLRAAGVELLRSPNPADQAAAASAFEALYAADPVDRITVAGLVASLASDSATPEQAERQQKLAASLTPVDQLTKGVDVAALLQGGVAALSAPAAVAGKKRAAPAASAETAATTEPLSKKAKTGSAAKPAALSRQAKKLQAKSAAAGDDSFDVNKKLDAERWLPLRDRSSYRPPKGKKGKRRGEAATMQGGVVKEEETLALAGGAGSVRVEKAPQGPSAAAKKRKKGKK